MSMCVARQRFSLWTQLGQIVVDITTTQILDKLPMYCIPILNRSELPFNGRRVAWELVRLMGGERQAISGSFKYDILPHRVCTTLFSDRDSSSLPAEFGDLPLWDPRHIPQSTDFIQCSFALARQLATTWPRKERKEHKEIVCPSCPISLSMFLPIHFDSLQPVHQCWSLSAVQNTRWTKDNQDTTGKIQQKYQTKWKKTASISIMKVLWTTMFMEDRTFGSLQLRLSREFVQSGRVLMENGMTNAGEVYFHKVTRCSSKNRIRFDIHNI